MWFHDPFVHVTVASPACCRGGQDIVEAVCSTLAGGEEQGEEGNAVSSAAKARVPLPAYFALAESNLKGL